MHRLLVIAGGVLGATAIAVPAVVGFAGNPSFAEKVTVRVPHTARAVSVNHGRAVERETRREHAPVASHPTPSATAPVVANSHRVRHPEPGDDRGTGTEPEPGDDRGTGTEPEPGDDRGTARSSHSGDDAGHTGHGGHGGDDRT